MPLRRLSPGIEQPADLELITEDDPLARELANVDALPEQSQRLLDRVSEAKRGSGKNSLSAISWSCAMSKISRDARHRAHLGCMGVARPGEGGIAPGALSRRRDP